MPDGKRITVGFYQGIIIWDIKESKEFMNIANPFHTLAVSPDGRQIAVKEYVDLIKILDTETGNELHTLSGHESHINNFVFSPDGEILISCSDDKEVILWDTKTGAKKLIFSGHKAPVRSVAISPDGKWIASVSREKSGDNGDSLRLWKTATGKEIAYFPEEIKTVTFSPDSGQLIYRSIHDHLIIWDIFTKTETRSIYERELLVKSSIFSPDGKYFMYCSYKRNCYETDGVTIIEIKSGMVVMTLPESVLSRNYFSKAVCGQDDNCITVEYGKNLVILNTRNGQNPVRFSKYNYSKDGKYVITKSYETIKILDAETGEKFLSLSSELLPSNFSAEFSPDGKYIISNGSHEIIIFSVETGQELSIYSKLASLISSVSLSPDGRHILSVQINENTIKVWNAEYSESSSKIHELFTLSGHHARINMAIWSMDSKRIYSCSGEDRNIVYANNYRKEQDFTLRIWDIEDQAELKNRELSVLSGHTNGITSLAESPDGKRLISASDDGTIRLWDIETCQELRVFSYYWIDAVVRDPEERLMLESSWEKTMQAWHDSEAAKSVNSYNIIKDSKGRPAEKPVIDNTIQNYTPDITLIGWKPESKYFALQCYNFDDSDMNKYIMIWDMESCQLIKTLALPRNISSAELMAWDTSGKNIVFIDHNARSQVILKWDIQNNSVHEIFTLEKDTHISSIILNLDGKIISAGSYNGHIVILSIKDGKINMQKTFKAHEDRVTALAYSPDGKYLVSGSSGNEIIMRDTKFWHKKRIFLKAKKIAPLFMPNSHVTSVTSISFSPDGKRMLSGHDSRYRTIKVWDTDSGKECISLSGGRNSYFDCPGFLFPRSEKTITGWSPDGGRFLSAGDDTLKIWDAENMRLLRTFSRHNEPITSAIWSQDGKYIVTASRDGTIRIWDPDKGQIKVIEVNSWISLNRTSFFEAALNHFKWDILGR
jgi:WD40 repeat protein